MEPRIQYAKTKDGVNIAYWTLGEGMPFVHLADPPWSHAQLEWQFPEWRRWYEGLAQKRKLIRFDFRGSGLSERDVSDYSLDAMVLDLEAVTDRLALDAFALLGVGSSGPVAVAYAVRHPQAVAHLLLWHCWARGSDWLESPQTKQLGRMAETEWEMFTETAAHHALGWAEGDTAHRFAAVMRECVTPSSMQAMYDGMRVWDVSDLLPHVASRTLVLHRRQVQWLDVAIARGLAARIPDARLVVLEGRSGAFALEDPAAVLQVIDGFLDEGEEAGPAAGLPEGITAILFADIADSTPLTERLGDAAFRAKAREVDEALRSAIREHHGTPIEGKLLGDGVLATFGAAREAIACAQACHEAGSHAGLPLHVGIHAGDVIREEGNVYGGAVNIASRIADASAPGETLVSGTVRDLARTSAGVSFEDRGERELKGVSDAVRLWAVRAGDV